MHPFFVASYHPAFTSAQCSRPDDDDQTEISVKVCLQHLLNNLYTFKHLVVLLWLFFRSVVVVVVLLCCCRLFVVVSVARVGVAVLAVFRSVVVVVALLCCCRLLVVVSVARVVVAVLLSLHICDSKLEQQVSLGVQAYVYQFLYYSYS